MYYRIKAAFALAALSWAATTPAWADAIMDAPIKPASAASIEAFISGRTWIWNQSKGLGVYFAPDKTFIAAGNYKGDPQAGKGTWMAMEGNLCWTGVWISKDRSWTGPSCTPVVEGPGTDGTQKSKDMLAFQKQDKSGYFWVSRDGKTFKDFVKGDKESKKADQWLASWKK